MFSFLGSVKYICTCQYQFKVVLRVNTTRIRIQAVGERCRGRVCVFPLVWRSRMRVNRQIEQNKKNGTNFHVGLLLDGGGEGGTPPWAERIVGDFCHNEAALDCRSGGCRRQRIRRESSESLFILLLAAAWAVLRTVLHRKCGRGQGRCSCYHGHRPRHKQHTQLQALHVNGLSSLDLFRKRGHP